MPPKQRQIVALLATHLDQIVPTSSLMRELWGDERPKTAATTLQTYIGQLRRALARAGGTDVPDVVRRMLVTASGGYRLTRASVHTDLDEYHAVSASGKAAVRAGDDQTGAPLLSRALDLWRGPVLVDVDAGDLLRAQIAKLEECKLHTVEHWVWTRLRMGEHQAVVSDLVAITSLHPLHERMHGQLILALYRNGRRAEALAVFRDLRARLIAELGLEPSAELLRLHQAILTADPSLEAVGDDHGSLAALLA